MQMARIYFARSFPGILAGLNWIIHKFQQQQHWARYVDVGGKHCNVSADANSHWSLLLMYAGKF